MSSNKEFNALIQVLSGEQQVIQRTDQKAFTLLSVLGVFMVFFIVHFPKLSSNMNLIIFVLMMVYMISAMGTIYFLVRVIVPRVRISKVETDIKFKEKEEIINPTFFAGISQFRTSNEYAKYLRSVTKSDEQLYNMFASQVFALGQINNTKNLNIRKSIYFFISALISELMMIMIVAYLVFKNFLFI